MNTMVLLRVLLSPTHGWKEAVESQNSAAKVLFLLVIPCMLLPPAMLLTTGAQYRNLIPALGNIPWEFYAPFLFLLEIMTFAVFIIQIRNIANNYGVAIGYYEAFLLASISIIPICISFLTFAIPSIGFILGLVFGAICYSCFIFYKGLHTYNESQEEICSVNILYTVVGAAIGWGVLLVILITIS